MPSKTIDCIKNSFKSWKALAKRLEYFDQDILQKVNPHTVTNEALVEHAFGFTKLKGQCQLQSMEEYVFNKMKNEIDFQMRLVKLDFCQYVKVKLRDKSYQNLDEQFKSLLTIDDISEILFAEGKKSQRPSGTKEISSADENLLKQAYLTTKSVPRQSNRAKWKERSGFAPNMLTEKDEGSKLLVGDMVFCRDPLDGIRKLIVQDEIFLGNVAMMVNVKDVEILKTAFVSISDLLIYKGLVFVIPSQLYDIVDNSVRLKDLASQLFEDFVSNVNDSNLIYTEEAENWKLK